MDGFIYKITGKESGKVYYGSTMQRPQRRFDKHINDKSSRPTSSKEIIENEEVEFTVIEKLKNITREELLYRERYYYENFECVNKICPIRGKEERRILKNVYGSKLENKEHRKIYDKQNRKMINDTQKKRRDWYKIRNEFFNILLN